MIGAAMNIAGASLWGISGEVLALLVYSIFYLAWMAELNRKSIKKA